MTTSEANGVANSVASRARVAFGGYFASGKTECADYLIEKHGFTRIGFMTPVYQLQDIHLREGFDREERLARWILSNLKGARYSGAFRGQFMREALEIFDSVPKTPGVKNRNLLQAVGAMGRALDPYLWTNLFALNVEKAGPASRIVNDNLRYENELEVCRELGFVCVFVDAPEDVRRERYARAYGVAPTPEQLSHESESEIARVDEGCHVTIYNHSEDKAKLHRILDKVLVENWLPFYKGALA